MPENYQSPFMVKSPDLYCIECGLRFSYEDRDYRLEKVHTVEGYYDHYDYEEVLCCPRCGGVRVRLDRGEEDE